MYSYTPKIILVKTIFAGEPSIPSDVVCYDCTMRSWRRQGDSDGGKDNVWLHTQASLRVTVVFSTKKRRGNYSPGRLPCCTPPPVPSRHARCRPYIVSGPAQGPPSPGFPPPPRLPGHPANSALHTTRTSRRGDPVLCATSNPKPKASCPAARNGWPQPQRPQTKQIPPRLFSVEKTQQPLPLRPYHQPATHPTRQPGRTTNPTQTQQNKEQQSRTSSSRNGGLERVLLYYLEAIEN